MGFITRVAEKYPFVKRVSNFNLEHYIMNIISIFSGRKPNLEILTRYLNVALDLHMINEVHFWNYARNPEDEIFIKELCDTYKHFYVLIQMIKLIGKSIIIIIAILDMKTMS